MSTDYHLRRYRSLIAGERPRPVLARWHLGKAIQAWAKTSSKRRPKMGDAVRHAVKSWKVGRSSAYKALKAADLPRAVVALPWTIEVLDGFLSLSPSIREQIIARLPQRRSVTLEVLARAVKGPAGTQEGGEGRHGHLRRKAGLAAQALDRDVSAITTVMRPGEHLIAFEEMEDDRFGEKVTPQVCRAAMILREQFEDLEGAFGCFRNSVDVAWLPEDASADNRGRAIMQRLNAAARSADRLRLLLQQILTSRMDAPALSRRDYQSVVSALAEINRLS